MFEFLGQMFEPFQPHEFSQKPLLEPLFAAQKAVPGPVDIGDHLSLSGHVGGPIGQPQLGLQGVEVCFQPTFKDISSVISSVPAPYSSFARFFRFGVIDLFAKLTLPGNLVNGFGASPQTLQIITSPMKQS